MRASVFYDRLVGISLRSTFGDITEILSNFMIFQDLSTL